MTKSSRMKLNSALREIVRSTLQSLAREMVQEEIRNGSWNIPQLGSRSTYPGDSEAKKSVRLRVWELVRDVLGLDSFKKGKHIFLASHEGGDASTLRGLDVPDSSMIAIDMNMEELRHFRTKFPDVMSYHGDVDKILREICEVAKPASVFLDFSSHVSENTLQRVKTAIHTITPGGVLACTFAVGREKHWNKKPSLSNYKVYESRFAIIEECIENELGYKPKVLKKLRYTSESMKGPGSSIMCVLIVQLARGRGARELVSISVQDLYRDAYRYRRSPALKWLLNLDLDRAEVLRKRVVDYPPPRVA